MLKNINEFIYDQPLQTLNTVETGLDTVSDFSFQFVK